MEENQNQVQAVENEEAQIDLVELFYVLLHRLWIIILAGVICAGAVGIWTKKMITPQYASTSMIYMLNSGASITSIADIQIGSELAPDYLLLVKSRPVLETVIENLDLTVSYEQLSGSISLTNPSDTRIVKITATNPDPKAAKSIADEVAKVSIKKVAELMKMEEPSLIEEGQIASAPASPNTRKNCMMGGLLGVVVAAAAIILLHMMNDSVSTQEDVERYLGLSVLGAIPAEDGEQKSSRHRRKRKRKEIGKRK